MFRLMRFCLIILIIAGFILTSHSAKAARTLPVSTGFVSERKTTFITLYRDGIASPMPLLVSELAQNVDALDNAFHQMQNAGRLLSNYPVLVVEITDDAYTGFLPSGPKADGYAVLSLENEYRLDLYPLHTTPKDIIDLGPVYRIQVVFRQVSINELFALAFLLPELNTENPRKELLAADIRHYRDKFDDDIANESLGWTQKDVLWSPDGNLLLFAHWYNRRLSYFVLNFATNERILLDSLDHYIMPPTFSTDSRFIFYASQTELKIFDVVKQYTQSLSLRDKIPYDYQAINFIDYAVNEAENSLFFIFGGWVLSAPPALLWRGPAPGLAEIKNITDWHMEYEAEFGSSAGTGVPVTGYWSNFTRGSFPSTFNTVAEFAELERKMTASKNDQLTIEDEQLMAIYGAICSKAVNYPQNNRLAILVDEGKVGHGIRSMLHMRVLSVPSLEEIYTHRFAVVPEPKSEIPGTIAGIPLFNVIIAVLVLLMAVGMTKFIFFIKQKYGKQPAARISIKKSFLFFVGALLVIMLIHFVAFIITIAHIDDRMGGRAFAIAEQTIEQKYTALGYTVDFTGGGSKTMAGSSHLSPIDFPYQVLYWRLSGYTRFAAPMEIGFGYRVYNRKRHFVKHESVRYYVMGVNRFVLLPTQ